MNPNHVTTSTEDHKDTQRDLSPVSDAFPDVRLIPAGELWSHHAAAVRSESDPRGSWRCTNGAWLSDGEMHCHGQRLVPTGPLLALLTELDHLATDVASYSEETAVWVRSCADRLRAALGEHTAGESSS